MNRPKAVEEDLVLKSAAGGASVAAFSCYDAVERSIRAATSRAGKRPSSTRMKRKKIKTHE
jgi:hypothetical protein